jgi:hypothetical protein
MFFNGIRALGFRQKFIEVFAKDDDPLALHLRRDRLIPYERAQCPDRQTAVLRSIGQWETAGSNRDSFN